MGAGGVNVSYMFELFKEVGIKEHHIRTDNDVGKKIRILR